MRAPAGSEAVEPAAIAAEPTPSYRSQVRYASSRGTRYPERFSFPCRFA